ncbi:hypothetical protein L13192_05482 [Pyrenophora tritici-repentis]|uniref:Uncharacterized protein n=1 Tax=Pyrenophora tritici-repentis TaxID=45151 RepID=A0A922N8P0_9PLEO|nr:hypothetical protein Ptr86124_010300 [Pyrenophora tritici-repentis]KAI1669966.1 hypothetical protein L13192_05482 [Pyrenophora tritici-repentis]KAI1681561.1 hypothetical protein KJE20_08432 [Pyrenophora tritici-repentis]
MASKTSSPQTPAWRIFIVGALFEGQGHTGINFSHTPDFFDIGFIIIIKLIIIKLITIKLITNVEIVIILSILLHHHPHILPFPILSSKPHKRWRTASPPKASGTPDFKNLAEGQVLFLTDNGAPQSSILWNKKGGGAPSGHPVVVVKKFINANSEECVRFRTLTSFGGHSLEERKPLH